MDYLNRQGETVYLKACTDVLYKHLNMGRNVRPLLLNKTADEVKAYIQSQLREREIYYQKAQYTFDVTLLDQYEKIKLAVTQLRALLNL